VLTAALFVSGCVGGDENPTAIGADAAVGGPIALAAGSQWGDGRAVFATTTPTGTTVVVTTTELVAVPAGTDVPLVLDRFDAAAQPGAIAVSADQPIAAVGFTSPPSIRTYRLDDGSAVGAISLPADAAVTSLTIAGDRIVASTPVGPFVAPLTGTVASPVVEVPVSGSPAILPDGTVWAPVTGTAELAVAGIGGETRRAPLTVGSEETLLDARVSPTGALVGVTAGAGPDPFERTDRVLVLDAASLQVRAEISIGTAIDPTRWTLLDDSVVVAEGSGVRWFGLDGVAQDVGSGIDSQITELIALPGNLVTVHANGALALWPADTRSPLVMGDDGLAIGNTTVDVGRGTFTVVDEFGGITVRNAADGAPVRSISSFASGELTDLAVAGDGRIAVTSTMGAVTVLDAGLVAQDEFTVTDGRANLGAIEFAPGSTTVAVGVAERVRELAFDDTVRALDAVDGRPVFQIGGEATDVAGCAFFYARVRFSPDGRFVATASHDFSVEVVDVATGAVAYVLPGEVTVLDLAFSPEGDRLVASSDDGVVRVWDTSDYSLEASYRAAQGGYYALALLPDGVMAAADITGAITLSDVTTGEVSTRLEGATQRTNELAVSPDGTLIAAPTAGGGIGVWSTIGGAPIATAAGHSGQVSGIAFTADGDTIATASLDGTVRTWLVGNG
jgi:WD domain, G-beta repeat